MPLTVYTNLMRVSKGNAISNAFILCGCGCRELIPEFNKMGLPASYKHGHNLNGKLERGSLHPNWKGGRYKDSAGYWKVYKPHHKFATKRGYVMEHHLVWEEFYKAVILPWGVVHHINENPEYNRIENLQGMMKKDHTRYHNFKLGKLPPYQLGRRKKV